MASTLRRAAASDSFLIGLTATPAGKTIAVGVCERDKTDSRSLNRQHAATLEELLSCVAQGGPDPDALTTLAGRLARMRREFSREQLAELKDLADGRSFPDLAHGLLNACDPDAQISWAKSSGGATGEPTAAQVRHAIHPADVPLKPYAEEVRTNYAVWKSQRRAAGADFAGEKQEWLDRIAEHIATSLAMEPEDFETGWFGQHGGLGPAHAVFGAELEPILAELNEKLAA